MERNSNARSNKLRHLIKLILCRDFAPRDVLVSGCFVRSLAVVSMPVSRKYAENRIGGSVAANHSARGDH